MPPLERRGRLLAYQAASPEADWRDALATRLGARPRRLGQWAELALWGARQCLDAAGWPVWPTGARLQLCSLSVARDALQRGLQEVADPQGPGLPSPFTFLQAQAALGLTQVAAALHGGPWVGEARLVNAHDEARLLEVAAHAARHRPVLLGRVELVPVLQTRWWLFAPGAD